MNQEVIYAFVKELNTDYIGPLLVVLLLGTGIYFTIRLKFVPRYYLRAIQNSFHMSKEGIKASGEIGMSPLQALSTAIASQVGTGNIVGVSMALLMGGPGALFWMWVSALMGMSTNFAEAILGQLYKRKTEDGNICGGPAFYIHYGMNKRFLAMFFSIFFIIAITIGTMVQANSISNSVITLFPDSVNPLVIGICLAVFVGLVLSGGISRIASFAERIVPLMAGLFITGCLIFIIMHASNIVPVFADVFRYAFTPKAGVGGAAGVAVMTAIRYGISRGLFSNEAGLGTTPHAHAIAKVNKPYEQGMMAVVGISVDLIVCTFSALVILLSGVLDNSGNLVGIHLVQAAFDSSFGAIGNWFIAVSLFFFAMSTIVGWYFFGAQNLRYLCGNKLITPYLILTLVLIILSTVIDVPLIWELVDTFNLFIVLPNVLAIIWLSPKVVEEVKRMHKDFLSKRQGE